MNNAEPLKNIRVVLIRTSHPGNIGGTARAMKTMGLTDLHLVLPRMFPHADALARATGAVDVLERAQVHASLAPALDDCVLAVATTSRHRELRHETATVREAARTMVDIARTGPVAIVFGNETSGLTSAEAAACELWASIPANPAFLSLNVAAAVQVCAYELRMACVEPPPPRSAEFPLATHDEVAQLYAHLEQTMVNVGFHDPAHPRRLPARLKRLLARARLETDEVSLLRGFLRAVNER